MKNSLRSKLFALSAVLLISLAGVAHAQSEASEAGLFIEPGLTYEFGKTSTGWPFGLSNSTGESNGFGLAGRLGMHVADIFFLGLDGRYSMTNFKDSSVNYGSDATQLNWGPLVGVQTPLYGIRVWASYVAGGFLDPKSSGGGFDVRLEDPTGFRLGAGLRYMMFSVNLEYQNVQYAKTALEAYGSFSVNTSFSSVKPRNESWILSVSFPFAI